MNNKKNLGRSMKLLRLLQKLFNLKIGEIDGLSPRQALDYEFQKRIMYDLDWRIGSKFQTKQKIIAEKAQELRDRISKYYKGSLRSIGISEKSLDRKYRIWKSLDEDKKIKSIRFYSLIKDKSYAIKKLGLNGDVVKNFFKIINITIDEWAKEKGLSPERIHSVLNNRRIYGTEEAIALRDSISKLRNDLQSERRNILAKIRKDSKNLANIENKLVLLNALKESNKTVLLDDNRL